MKSFLFKICLFLIVLTSASKCNGSGDGSNLIMVGFQRVMTVEQIDSLCRADTLAYDLESWIHADFVDYETGSAIRKYSYIKELTDSTELIYIITYKDGTYNVLKRVVEPE